MFTGIIERTGTIVSLGDSGGVKRLVVAAPGVAGRLRVGDSLAVSGVCLTALDGNGAPHLLAGGEVLGSDLFHADLAAETLARTSLGSLAAGSLVNLELPIAAGSPMGGHVVQGHVDGTGRLISLKPVVSERDPKFNRETTDWWLTVSVPEHVQPWMVEKGSVAIEGISLTIAAVGSAEAGRAEEGRTEEGRTTISIAILPLTYWRTNLHVLAAGAPVNIEADVLVKLAAMQSKTPEPEFELTENWLVANGY